MIAVPIKDYTRMLGPPRDWDDTLDGECGHLAVQDTLLHGSSAQVSAWKPDAEDLKILIAGGCVTLWIVGQAAHPVVAMGVASAASCIARHNEPIDV